MSSLWENQPFKSLETSVDNMIERGHASVPKGRLPGENLDLNKIYTDAKSRELVSCLILDPSSVSSLSFRAFLHKLYLFRGLLVLYQVAFKEALLLSHCVLTSMRKTRSWPDSEIVAYIKYALVCPLAEFMRNPPPKKPEAWTGSYLISSGAIQEFERHFRLQQHNATAAWYFSSLQDVKNACCPMDERDFLEAYRQHAVLLAKPAPPLPDDPLVLKRIRGMIRSTLGVRRLPRLQVPEIHDIEISQRACLTQSVRKGGAARQVMLDSRQKVPCVPRGDGLFFTEFLSTEIDTRIHLDLEPQLLLEDPPTVREEPLYRTALFYSSVSSTNSLALEQAKLQFILGQGFPDPEMALHGYYSDPDELRGLFEEPTPVPIWAPRSVLVDHLLHYGLLHSRAEVRAAAIAESLKVRIVTLGDAYTGAVSMHAQKDLFRRLRRLKQFALIGEPLETEHLDAMLARYKSLHGTLDDVTLVSGDYKSATDCLNMNLTKMVLEIYLTECVEGTDQRSELFRHFCRKNLYEQIITYPPVLEDGKKVQIEAVQQRNGQLMGSQLSFPVLCILNLVTYWLALEQYLGRPVTLEELPALVNGDDISFPATLAMIDVWKKALEIPGFLLSVGKNFIHLKFLTMNSMFFVRDGERFSKVHKLNTGLLLKDTVKRRTVDLGRDLEPLIQMTYVEPAQLAAELIRGAETEKRPFLMARFLHYHKASLSHWSQKGRRNFFVSPALGGLGLPRVPGYSYHYTRWQRAEALRLSRLHGLRIDDHSRRPVQVQGYKRDSTGIQIEARRFSTYVPGHITPTGWVVQPRETVKTLANSGLIFGSEGNSDPDGQWKDYQTSGRLRDSDWELAHDELMATDWKICCLETTCAKVLFLVGDPEVDPTDYRAIPTHAAQGSFSSSQSSQVSNPPQDQ
jgi:hypothetical protein